MNHEEKKQYVLEAFKEITGTDGVLFGHNSDMLYGVNSYKIKIIFNLESSTVRCMNVIDYKMKNAQECGIEDVIDDTLTDEEKIAIILKWT